MYTRTVHTECAAAPIRGAGVVTGYPRVSDRDVVCRTCWGRIPAGVAHTHQFIVTDTP